MEKERTYLHHINYFRGIAIVFIVFGHCFNIGIVQIHSNNMLLAKLSKNLIPGGTAFFVFISGYLLHYIYFKNFQFLLFIKKKVKYIFLPFIFLSSTDIIYYISSYLIALLNNSNKIVFYLSKIKSYEFTNTYLFGHGIIPIGLWYIPFVMLVFLLTPIYLKFMKLSNNTQLFIIFLGIFQNVIYFSPIYLLGIYFSLNSNIIYEKISGKEIFILILVFAIALIQTRIGAVEDIMIMGEGNKFKINYIDLMILQKSLLSIFLILILKKNETVRIRILEILAENSFGIFFLHGISIWILNASIYLLNISYISYSLIIYILTAIYILFFSLGITILTRKLLPNYSKYIIGC